MLTESIKEKENFLKMCNLTNENDGYFKGDAFVYTGKSEMIYGGVFYQIEMIEGHQKGEKKWIAKSPK
jgi:hypothetical protein